MRRIPRHRTFTFFAQPVDGTILLDAPLGFEARSLIVHMRATAGNRSIFIPDAGTWIRSLDAPVVLRFARKVSTAHIEAQRLNNGTSGFGGSWNGTVEAWIHATYTERALCPSKLPFV